MKGYEMNDFNDYATKAINRCNLKSYYGLAKELDISHSALHRLKTGAKLPSCNTMLKLSKLAGVPEEKALIDLSSWANSDKPEVQKIWLRIAKMIGCFWLFSVFGCFAVKPCYSIENSPTFKNFESANVYIMRQICKFVSTLKIMLQSCNIFKLGGVKC